MVKQNIDTSDSVSPSFGPHSCSATQMDCSGRRNLSVQAIRRTESVAHLAQQHQVSRKFVYRQLAKATVAIDQAFEPAEPKDQKVLFYLPITKAWIHQLVLSLILICHSSFRGVLDILDAMFDYHDMSLGTIHNIVQQAVVSARRVNDSQDLSVIRIGDHDEIYQANRPVLVGIDHRSTYCYLLAVEDSCDETTWGVHLLDLSDHGLDRPCVSDTADQDPGTIKQTIHRIFNLARKGEQAGFSVVIVSTSSDEGGTHPLSIRFPNVSVRPRIAFSWRSIYFLASSTYSAFSWGGISGS